MPEIPVDDTATEGKQTSTPMPRSRREPSLQQATLGGEGGTMRRKLARRRVRRAE